MQGAHHQLQQTRNVAGGTRASTSHYSTQMNDPRYIPMAELYAPPPQPDQDTHPQTQGFHQPNSSEIAPPRAGFATDKYSTSDSDHLIRSRRHEYMSIPPLLCKDQGNGENVPMAKFQTLPNRKSKGAHPPINQHSPPSDIKRPQSQLLHQPRQQAYDPYVPMSALQSSQDGDHQSLHPATEYTHMLYSQRTSEGNVQMGALYQNQAQDRPMASISSSPFK